MVFAVLLGACHSPQSKLRHEVASHASVEQASFGASLSAVIGRSILQSNRVTPLVNGDQIVPAMLAAIRSASNHVHLETFLWASGQMSDAFIEALSERARTGVKVRAVVDALGSRRLKKIDIERLRAAGVAFRTYNPPDLSHLHRLNYRDHRKVLVVDGRIGFIGSACIADEWLGNAETVSQWRDTHFEVRGPVVSQVQGAFAVTWLKTDGELLFGPDYFPALPPAGPTPAAVFSHDDRDESARLTYLAAIAAARTSIRLGQAYFVPDDLSLKALCHACERGVKVEIIAPSAIDVRIVRRASRALWPDLLRAGVHIYEYQPAMYHCKFLIVDDVFATCGSVNFDERSFHINDESNINVIDRDFAALLVRQFEADKARSKRITEPSLKHKPWYIRTTEAISSLFRAQL